MKDKGYIVLGSRETECIDIYFLKCVATTEEMTLKLRTKPGKWKSKDVADFLELLKKDYKMPIIIDYV